MRPGCLVLVLALAAGACNRAPDVPASTASDAASAASAAPVAPTPSGDTPGPAGSTSAPRLPPGDVACSRDEDCVPMPACCHSPCGDGTIHAKAAERYQPRCPPDLQCPRAGGCFAPHANLCVHGECTMVYAGQPGYHPR